MHPFWKTAARFGEKVEHYNSKLIPYAIVALLTLIIFELFLHIDDPTAKLILHILDYLVIMVFVIDLIFLAIKAKSVRFCFKNYWLDVLAIFPFVMFFNAINFVYRAAIATAVVTERVAVSQAVLHETVEVGKEIEVLAKGEGKIAKVSRIVARGIRAVTKSRFFEKLQAKHKRIRKKPGKSNERHQ